MNPETPSSQPDRPGAMHSAPSAQAISLRALVDAIEERQRAPGRRARLLKSASKLPRWIRQAMIDRWSQNDPVLAAALVSPFVVSKDRFNKNHASAGEGITESHAGHVSSTVPEGAQHGSQNLDASAPIQSSFFQKNTVSLDSPEDQGEALPGKTAAREEARWLQALHYAENHWRATAWERTPDAVRKATEGRGREEGEIDKTELAWYQNAMDIWHGKGLVPVPPRVVSGDIRRHGGGNDVLKEGKGWNGAAMVATRLMPPADDTTPNPLYIAVSSDVAGSSRVENRHWESDSYQESKPPERTAGWERLFVFAHETAHAIFQEIDNPFHPGIMDKPGAVDNDTRALLQKMFRAGLDGWSSDTGLWMTLNETFADVYGAMMLLEGSDHDPEAVDWLTHVGRHRLVAQGYAESMHNMKFLLSEGAGDMDTHITGAALLGVVVQRQVWKGASPQSLRNLALRIASDHVLSLIHPDRTTRIRWLTAGRPRKGKPEVIVSVFNNTDETPQATGGENQNQESRSRKNASGASDEAPSLAAKKTLGMQEFHETGARRDDYDPQRDGYEPPRVLVQADGYQMMVENLPSGKQLSHACGVESIKPFARQVILRVTGELMKRVREGVSPKEESFYQAPAPANKGSSPSSSTAFAKKDDKSERGPKIDKETQGSSVAESMNMEKGGGDIQMMDERVSDAVHAVLRFIADDGRRATWRSFTKVSQNMDRWLQKPAMRADDLMDYLNTSKQLGKMATDWINSALNKDKRVMAAFFRGQIATAPLGGKAMEALASLSKTVKPSSFSIDLDDRHACHEQDMASPLSFMKTVRDHIEKDRNKLADADKATTLLRQWDRSVPWKDRGRPSWAHEPAVWTGIVFQNQVGNDRVLRGDLALASPQEVVDAGMACKSHIGGKAGMRKDRDVTPGMSEAKVPRMR